MLSFFLLSATNTFAQEKGLTLPDYTKWELSEWDFQDVLYKGKVSYVLGASYQDGNDDRIVIVYFEPISEEQYQILGSLDQLEVEKRVDLMLGEVPLFIMYFGDGQNNRPYFYEQSRKWFEAYRFWRPKFRFVGKITGSDLRFIEQRYKFKFVEE